MIARAGNVAVLTAFLRMEARGRPRRSLARFLAVHELRDAVRASRGGA